VRYRQLELPIVVLLEQVARRPLVKPMDELGELSATHLTCSPLLESGVDRNQGAPQFLLVCRDGCVANGAFQPLRHLLPQRTQGRHVCFSRDA